VALGVLVTVHEFGHFMIAKAMGMRVDEFAIGFGKALFTFRRGETQYSLRLIPLGGYNRVFGMEFDEETAEKEYTEEEKKRAFNLQPAKKRAAVIFAGSLMNLALAVILIFSLRFFWGDEIPQVDSVNPNGPAWKGGILQGDVIRAIAGEKVGGMNINELIQKATLTQGGVKVTIERQGEVIPITINSTTLSDIDRRFWDLGAVYYPNGLIASVLKGTSAQKLGLQVGDYVTIREGKIPERLVEVDGERYLALDVQRSDRVFTLALPETEVQRVNENFSGLGFRYDQDWVVTWVEELNPFTYTPTQVNLRGLKKGDKLLSVSYINEKAAVTIHPIDEFKFAVDDPFAPVANGPIGITFQHGNDTRTKKFNAGEQRRLLGIGMMPKLNNIVQAADPQAKAFKAGLRNGDEIIAIGNEPTVDGLAVLTKLEFAFQANQGDGYKLLYDPMHLSDVNTGGTSEGTSNETGIVESEPPSTDSTMGDTELIYPSYKPYFSHVSPYITLKIQRGDETQNIIIDLTHGDSETDLMAFLGFGFAPVYRPMGFLESWKRGFTETGYYLRNITESLNMLLTREARLRDLTGPLGIITITYRFAESGLKSLISIVILLTVNLAVINLFPLPALDGGRLVFLVLEMAFRRPVVSVKVENIIHLAGILLLLVLLVYITFYDIIRVYQWW